MENFDKSDSLKGIHFKQGKKALAKDCENMKNKTLKAKC